MDTVCLLALEICLGIFILNFFPEPYGILVFAFLIGAVGVTLKRKIFFYWVIPAVFFISFSMKIDRKDYKKGEMLSKIEVNLYEGRGEIVKIGNKFPQKKKKVVVDRMEDGKYEITGKIERVYEGKNEIVYYLKPEKIENIGKRDLREKFQKRNERLLMNSRNDEKNLFLAVVSGKREGLSPRIKKLFIESGVSHLLAISGMHLGILLFLMDFLLRRTKLYKRERNIALFLGITLYFISVRESPSLERAYIMAVIYLMGNIFWENSESLKSLALAFITGIILKPQVYREFSFILSYWAMLVIFILISLKGYFSDIFKEKLRVEKNYLSQGLLALGNYITFTFFLQLGVAPLIYYLLGSFSLKAIFLSLIITPIGSIYIILCFASLIFPIMPITNLWYNLLIKSMEFFH